MALTIYLHPLASFCHKVLIGLYENGTEFEPVLVDFANPGSAAAHIERWPVGKIPVLHDSVGDRVVAETSIIIEYLQHHHAGPVQLIPDAAEHQLDVRLWDRFFDLYVSTPMQKIVGDRIRPDGTADPHGIAQAHATLETAYDMIEGQLDNRSWITGETFTMADCSAFPALFFGLIVNPLEKDRPQLQGYFERMLARPSVQRVLAEAQPYFDHFPYRDAMPSRFLEPAQ